MNNPPNEKNFHLSAEEFTTLREQLVRGDEALMERVFLRHFADCQAYLRQSENASTDDAYDATMEAFIAFRHRVILGKIQYGNLRFLLTLMAKQHLGKMRRAPRNEQLETEQEVQPPDDSIWDSDELRDLRTGWNRLGAACRELLTDFYYRKIEIKAIAAQRGKNAAALRKQKERCITSLKELVGSVG